MQIPSTEITVPLLSTVYVGGGSEGEKPGSQARGKVPAVVRLEPVGVFIPVSNGVVANALSDETHSSRPLSLLN